MQIRMRISPSGPFLEDSTSGDPLLIGTGTPGLVFRAQQGTLPINIESGSFILDSGVATGNAPYPVFSPFFVPVGYHYDIEGGFQCDVPGSLTCGFEYSADGGTTWNEIYCAAGPFTTQTDTSATATQTGAHALDFDATAIALVGAGIGAGGLRLRMFADGPALSSASFGWMRATQYVK